MCDDYALLALEVNHRVDSKTEFVEYCDEHNVEYRKVCLVEGGQDLAMSTGNGTGSSNPHWLIRPDRTCYQMNVNSWESQLVSEGISPHVCGSGISVFAPYGGNLLVKGNTYKIKWHSKGVSGNVKIELFKNNSLNKEITGSASNNGSYDWELTDDYAIGDGYSVKVTSIQNSSLVGQSSSGFSILEEKLNTLPYVQTFDTWGIIEHLDSWQQATDDDVEWIVHRGPTQLQGFGSGNTGAKSDHTSGEGQYIYLESAYASNANKVGSMITPTFDFSTITDPSLSFYYHMLSTNNKMGTFYIDVKVGDNAWQEGIVEITGNNGVEWKEYTLDLTSITNNNQRVSFRLRGITADAWGSDICIDDFRIDGESTPINNSVNIGQNYHLGYANSILQYRIPKSNEFANVNIKLFNAQGKEIRTLVNKAQNSGEYHVKLNDLSKGVYLCKMETVGFLKIIKILSK